MQLLGNSRVDLKRIREWAKQKEVLEKLKKKRGNAKQKRLKGAGRKVRDEEVEKAVFSWIGEMRANNLRVSRRLIKAMALEFSSIPRFRATMADW